MFPDIPVFWSWASLALKMHAFGAAATLALTALFLGCRFVWPFIRWVGVGLAVARTVSDIRSAFSGSDEN